MLDGKPIGLPASCGWLRRVGKSLQASGKNNSKQAPGSTLGDFGFLRFRAFIGMGRLAMSKNRRLVSPLARRGSESLWLVLLVVCSFGPYSTACQEQSTGASEERSVPTNASGWKDLSGRFHAVGKPATGSVSIVRHGERFELELRDVEVKDSGPVHIYLVGLPAAKSTVDVVGTDLKYDMGKLEPGSLQVIALPSRPDPALRSVVLWNPKYSVNLASAELSPER